VQDVVLSVLLLSLSAFHKQEQMQGLEEDVEALRVQLQQTLQDELWLIGHQLQEQRSDVIKTAQALRSCVDILSRPVSTAMRCYYSQSPQLHSEESMLAELDMLAADSEQLLSFDPLQPPTEAELRAHLRVSHAETQQETNRISGSLTAASCADLLSLCARYS
jgi:hypothetical protein